MSLQLKERISKVEFGLKHRGVTGRERSLADRQGLGEDRQSPRRPAEAIEKQALGAQCIGAQLLALSQTESNVRDQRFSVLEASAASAGAAASLRGRLVPSVEPGLEKASARRASLGSEPPWLEPSTDGQLGGSERVLRASEHSQQHPEVRHGHSAVLAIEDRRSLDLIDPLLKQAYRLVKIPRHRIAEATLRCNPSIAPLPLMLSARGSLIHSVPSSMPSRGSRVAGTRRSARRSGLVRWSRGLRPREDVRARTSRGPWTCSP